MSLPQIASHEDWLAARRELLAEEKALTRARDAVNTKRRELPMVRMSKDYRFTGPDGELGLPELFDGRRQLIVYHFMLGPEMDAGCPSCSYVTDNIGHPAHLHARNTTLALVSRAPLPKITEYRQRMGWDVPWYSSHGSDFNFDFHVTMDPAVQPSEYNFGGMDMGDYAGEMPGISVFLADGDEVFHTYSGYARGIDLVVSTNNWLDLTPLGRQEDWERPAGRSDGPMMSWLRRHDEYGS